MVSCVLLPVHVHKYYETINYHMHAAKCGYPLVADTSLRITGYHNPALEGATLTFSCPPGKILTGPNTTTCMENGEWEPDPTVEAMKCVGEYGSNSYKIMSKEI